MEPTFAPSVDDAALLQRYAGAADPAAFAELVRRYAGMVYATARRVTGDPSIAEDVSQDCFLRLARASDVIQGSLPAWLHRTSLNRSLELLRSDRARRRREAESAALVRDAADAKADDSAQLIAHVDEAMAQLPDELRAILTEHFLCGRTQQEIAHELKVDQSTVSRRVERALNELRDRLRAQGVAVATLPLVLSAASTIGTPAPPTLNLSLTKIGLAGVRGAGAGAAVSTVSASSATLALLIAGAALLIAGGGVGIWLHQRAAVTPSARAAPASSGRAVSAPIPAEREGLELFDRDVMVAWADAPAPVRETFAKAASGARIERLEMDREKGEIVYGADVPLDGKLYEITVAADGRLIAKKPADDEAKVKH